jgi:D-3-phosphoglycerate dehydrogenase
MHHNTPGVLAGINHTLAEHGVNIEAQLLSTRGDIGYVVTDIGADTSDEVRSVLRTMPQTIRLRVLS